VVTALDVAVLGIGSRTALMVGVEVEVDVAGAVDVVLVLETRSATGVESKVTWPGTVNRAKMHATTAIGQATSLVTARSPRRRGIRHATPVASLAM